MYMVCVRMCIYIYIYICICIYIYIYIIFEKGLPVEGVLRGSFGAPEGKETAEIGVGKSHKCHAPLYFQNICLMFMAPMSVR